MVVIAMTTERCIIIAITIICPDYSPAPVTGSSMLLYTVCAYYLTVNSFIIFIFVNNSSTVRAIQRALNKWKVELLADELYRFTDLDDPDLKLILDSFGIKIPVKLFHKTDLKSQIKNINIGI